MAKEILIIGGGITGLCSAYYLLQEGHRITILDSSDMTKGASYVNAGYLTPSHIIPLAAPGIITQALKWMLHSSSPFYVKPRLDPEFLKWSWYFKKSASAANVQKAIPLLCQLNLHSSQLYRELHQSQHLGDFHIEHKGVLMLYYTEQAGEKEYRVYERAKQEGLNATALSATELKTIEPCIHPRVRGAIHYLCDSHSTPGDFMERLKNYLLRKGVQVIPCEPVTGFQKSGNRISKVNTSHNTYAADEIVLAAGSWSARLAASMHIKLPLQPGKGYKIDVKQPTPINLPAILMEARVAVTPMCGFTRFAGTMELSGNNNQVRKNRVQAIAQAASAYYQDLHIPTQDQDAAQCGLRPLSPDGLPYIGKTTRYTNLTIATGHAMMGWSLGPITGKLVSEIISGRKTTLNIEPYHPERRF